MKYARFVFIGILIPLLSGCSFFSPKENESSDGNNATEVYPTDNSQTINETFKAEKIIEFDGSDDDKKLYEIRNGYTNGGMFLSYWKRNNVELIDGIANLSLYDDEDVNYGSEVRTYQGYLYGYFGVRMKTFPKQGTVQSFFTYNGGEYDHDEIDIEFLGKDTTKVQFNYYDNGVGGHEYLYDLGFDSSKEFHDYGFKWGKEKITWFVDFKPVYQTDAKLSQWGFIHMNVWAGNNEMGNIVEWLGEYEKTNEKLTACYDYISFGELN